MPPALVDWLPEEHFVWTVLGAVEQMDLVGFYGAYRANGQGRAAYDPRMMLSLLLYAYATGVSSSRQIERCCEVDVAFKVIAAMRVPDHSTIAEFRRRHQDAIADVFVQVLALCAEAGLVKVGVIAIDGTKIQANASRDCSRSYVSIVEELLADAEQADREEDERHGDDRGDEPPTGLRSRDERRQALAEAKARLEAQRREQLANGEAAEFEAGIELDLEQLRRRRQGRRSWQREASRQLDAHRERQADPIPRGRRDRFEDAKRRLEQELAVDTAANQAYEEFHASGRDTLGRRMGKHPKPHTPPVLPEGTVNLTDPDSRLIHDKRMTKLQGYNAQAAVSCDGQIILAAELSARSPDFGQLAPVFDAAHPRPQTSGRAPAPADGAGRHRLLALRADRSDRRRRHPSPDPTPITHPRHHPAGLGHRPLRVHARGPGQPRRQPALSPPRAIDRADLRADQAQPRLPAVPTTRPSRRPVGVAADHRHPQPPQAPPALDRTRHRLTPGRVPAPPRSSPAPAAHRQTFARQPRGEALADSRHRTSGIVAKRSPEMDAGVPGKQSPEEGLVTLATGASLGLAARARTRAPAQKSGPTRQSRELSVRQGGS